MPPRYDTPAIQSPTGISWTSGPKVLASTVNLKPASGIQTAHLQAEYGDLPAVQVGEAERCLGVINAFITTLTAEVTAGLDDATYLLVERILSTSNSLLLAQYTGELAQKMGRGDVGTCVDTYLTYQVQNPTGAIEEGGCAAGQWSTAAYWEQFPHLAEESPCVESGKCPPGFNLVSAGDGVVCAYQGEEGLLDETPEAPPQLEQKGMLEKGKDWWSAQPMVMKAGYGVMVAGSLYFLFTWIKGRK